MAKISLLGCKGPTALLVSSFCLFGLGLWASQVDAQSNDGARAPWQAPPGSGQWTPSAEKASFTGEPPAESPSLDAPQGQCRDCADGIVSGETCGGDCDIACDWLCDPCGAPCGQLRFQSEFLSWWTNSANLPPLATTSPNGTRREQAGVLGEQGTSVLFGGGVAPTASSGGRFTLGWSGSPCNDTGLEATYLFLGNNSVAYDTTVSNNAILARPLLNVVSGQQDAVLLAYPNVQQGAFSARLVNELNSVEALFRQALIRDCGEELDFLFGYRYARFREDLTIDSLTTYTTSVQPIVVGTSIGVSDLFRANNEFHGGEIGFSTRSRCNRWTLELLAKLGVGCTQSRVFVNGSSVVSVPGQSPVTYLGGMLALPTNSTTDTVNNLSVIPELGITLGYDLTCRLRATVGYTFLYWSQVSRPSNLVDLGLNTSQFTGGQLVGAPLPQLQITPTDFWAQGITAGLDYRF